MSSVPARLALLALCTGFVAVACRSTSPCCRSRSAAPSQSPAPSSFDVQTSRGAAAYGRYCAACHGTAGGGSKDAPALVGAGALPLTRPGAKFRTMPFRTAGDVARFAVATMPPVGEKPSGDDAWAIVAFALKANGVSRADAVGPANADSIVLHP